MSERKNPNKPPHRAQSLRHLAKSVDRTTRILARWPNTPHVDMTEVTKGLIAAQALMESAATKLDTLPDDYPPRRIAATAMIKPGATVAVKPQHRGQFSGLIPDAELDELLVIEVNDHSFTFRTPSGIVTLTSKRYVKAVQA